MTITQDPVLVGGRTPAAAAAFYGKELAARLSMTVSRRQHLYRLADMTDEEIAEEVIARELKHYPAAYAAAVRAYPAQAALPLRHAARSEYKRAYHFERPATPPAWAVKEGLA